MELSQNKTSLKFEPVIEAAAWTASELEKDRSWVFELSDSDQKELDSLVDVLEALV